VKHIIFGFIAFIHHNKYVQITQIGTHQYSMYHNIQALLNMSQRSKTSHILNLHLSTVICDKEINNLFRSVPLFKQFAM